MNGSRFSATAMVRIVEICFIGLRGARSSENALADLTQVPLPGLGDRDSTIGRTWALPYFAVGIC